MKKTPKRKMILKAAGIFLLIMTPIATSAVADGNLKMPILEIEKITGGYKSITAQIVNIGEADANNVTWSITIDDVVYRFLREINVSSQGMIDTLYAHDGSVDIQIDIPKGFGVVKVSLIAEVSGINRFEARIYAFVLGTRVFILP